MMRRWKLVGALAVLGCLAAAAPGRVAPAPAAATVGKGASAWVFNGVDKALAWPGSAGGASVTVGLSSVGPPPTLRMSQLLAIFMMTGSRSTTTFAPNTDR